MTEKHQAPRHYNKHLRLAYDTRPRVKK